CEVGKTHSRRTKLGYEGCFLGKCLVFRQSLRNLLSEDAPTTGPYFAYDTALERVYWVCPSCLVIVSVHAVSLALTDIEGRPIWVGEGAHVILVNLYLFRLLLAMSVVIPPRGADDATACPVRAHCERH